MYLDNSYLKEMTTTILEVIPETKGKWKIILKETVFYPMGGGQPTDQGMLYSKDWQGKVYQVLLQKGTIYHYVESENPPPCGVEVRGEINWERRYLHMRSHSAGHVIDFALYLLGYSPKQLMPVKADHGKKPAIFYQGIIDQDFRKELEEKANLLVSQNLHFSTKFVSYDELENCALYLQPGLPTNKPLRLLTLQSIGSVADGGTQVHSTGEIGPIHISHIETKEGMTIIHYSIEKTHE